MSGLRSVNLFTGSGVAATRVSPSASSFRTAMCMSARSGGEEKDDDEYRHCGDDRPDFQQAEETRIGFVRCLHFLLCHRFFPITPSAVRERTAQRPDSVIAPVLAPHPAMLKCG